MFPQISPINRPENRPFWSVMIPTYGDAPFLESTLLSVIAQDPGPGKMQIEMVDDCSGTDSSLETIAKLGLQDRVAYYRQPENLGLARNWNSCIERAMGEVVHILHQDDLVLQGFYHAMETAFYQEPNAGAVFCRHQFITSDGEIRRLSLEEQAEVGTIANWLEKIASSQRIQTPAIAVRRSVYEELGGFHPSLYYDLDWEMWIRISNWFPVLYVPRVLAAFRCHSGSETARLRQSAHTIRELPRFFLIRNSYLSSEIARKSERVARSVSARYTIEDGIAFLGRYQFRSGLVNVWEGLLCDFRPATILHLLQVTAYSLLMRFRTSLRRPPTLATQTGAAVQQGQRRLLVQSVDEPIVSVVVPTYNREELLCDTLRGLIRQDYPHFEIIVVDQSPNHEPSTEDFLHRHAQQIRYWKMEKPSLPEARNQGVRMSKGNIVLFVDDDVIPDSHLVSAHAAVYSSQAVGGVAGRRTLPGLEEQQEPVGMIDSRGRHISNFSSLIPTNVEWASGCNMSFRRDLIFQAGLFEPKFLGTAAYEDVDFCFRLRRLGYEIRFEPRAHLIHLRAADGGCSNRSRGYRYFYSAIHNLLLFALRHYSVRALPRFFAERMGTALSFARQTHNPLVLVPMAAAFLQVFHSYVLARQSLPRGVPQ